MKHYLVTHAMIEAARAAHLDNRLASRGAAATYAAIYRAMREVAPDPDTKPTGNFPEYDFPDHRSGAG
jgi:hypothetical protein